MSIRIIPRLDIKGPNLVKGIHLEGLRVLGKPEVFAKHYYSQGADELLYMDVVASLYQRNSLLEMVGLTSKELFIPLTVGGGLRNLEDIRAALKAGADKVAINTAAIRNPDFVREAAERFGSSTIVVSIEAIRKPDGTYEAYTDNGREKTGIDAIEWAQKAAGMGAGEIMITSIDREGTGKGFNLDLTRKIADTLSIPVIACGGAGTVRDIQEVISVAYADAVCVASVLHYEAVSTMDFTGDFSAEGNIEFLRHRRGQSHVEGLTIPVIKQQLIEAGIPCRPPVESGTYV
jgi:cyclase